MTQNQVHWEEMEPKDMVQMSWSDFQKSTTSFMSESRLNGDFTDVTLVCNDGEQTQVTAHKIILAAGSEFFESLLRNVSQSSCPLIFLKGVAAVELETILSFLYTGEASVQKARLEKFLAVANDLGVKGFRPEPLLESLEDQDDDQENEEHVDLKETIVESDRLAKFNNQMKSQQHIIGIYWIQSMPSVSFVILLLKLKKVLVGMDSASKNI